MKILVRNGSPKGDKSDTITSPAPFWRGCGRQGTADTYTCIPLKEE